jgi:hypothetical protein
LPGPVGRQALWGVKPWGASGLVWYRGKFRVR